MHLLNERRCLRDVRTASLNRCANLSANCVAGKSGAARNLSKREFVAEIPTSNTAQNGHVNHPYLPLKK
jgi:hypothetical protein